MNKKMWLILLIVAVFNTKIYAKDITPDNKYFKIQNNDNSIISLENISVFDSNNNKVGGKNWSSAVFLNNGNVLVGERKQDKTYDYYEVNKDGGKNYITNSKYYIKNINNKTGSFITVSFENNEYYLGVLDKEFNVVFDNIFHYKQDAFKDYTDILKIKNGGYGVFTIEGVEIIEPIFDKIEKIDDNNFKCYVNNIPYLFKNVDDKFINETALTNVPNWAKDSVKKAVNLGFVSQKLQTKLNQNITRAEFCEVLIKLYENKTGFTIETNNQNYFQDTNNIFVKKAYTLNIVKGKSNNKFEPDSPITRQEATVILSNLLDKMEYSTTEMYKMYNDENLIASWAKSSVQKVSKANLMVGDNKNNFNPNDNYKTVEAISTIMRFYNLK